MKFFKSGYEMKKKYESKECANKNGKWSRTLITKEHLDTRTKMHVQIQERAAHTHRWTYTLIHTDSRTQSQNARFASMQPEDNQ